jgi:hypothetical protein
MSNGLAHDIQARAAPVNPSSTSNTKWNPVRAVLAEALLLDPEDVYVATVSYKRNLKVRGEQADPARAKSVYAAMYTGSDKELPGTLTSAERRCQADHGLYLIFRDRGHGFGLEAIIKPASTAVPAVLSSAYPNALVSSC